MLIKFNKNDPRAGQIARMDSHRGQELIDSGAAVQVSDNDRPAKEASQTTATDPRAVALLDQNATTVVAAVAKGVEPEVLAAALEAEKAGKARKTVLEAIEAAQTAG